MSSDWASSLFVNTSLPCAGHWGSPPPSHRRSHNRIRTLPSSTKTMLEGCKSGCVNNVIVSRLHCGLPRWMASVLTVIIHAINLNICKPDDEVGGGSGRSRSGSPSAQYHSQKRPRPSVSPSARLFPTQRRSGFSFKWELGRSMEAISHKHIFTE